MICRLLPTALIAASLAAGPAGAQGQAAPASPCAPAIPTHKCVKPEYPGKRASPQRFNAFNKEFTAYGECTKRYVEETKLILDAAAAAVNGAVEEFNKFAADVKAQDEAAKN